MSGYDPIVQKLKEARFHLSKLEDLVSMDEFYPNANAFLTAAHSVLLVARHELGWTDRKSEQQLGFTDQQILDRKSFDSWYKNSDGAKCLNAHPLFSDRDVVIHRTGQAGFMHTSISFGGVAIEPGNAFAPSLVWRKGRISLPLEDKNLFFYVDRTGSKFLASEYCKAYLQQIEEFVGELRKYPWR